MPQPITNFFKGLTTQHIIAFSSVVGFVAFWVGEIKPQLAQFEHDRTKLNTEVAKIGDTFDKFRVEVADLRTEVKVQGAFLAQMDTLKIEVRDLRQDISKMNTYLSGRSGNP